MITHIVHKHIMSCYVKDPTAHRVSRNAINGNTFKAA